MTNEAVFDTSSLETIGVDNVIVSDQVGSEVESRGKGEGLIDDSRSVSVSSTAQCVNDNIEGDIKKAARGVDVMKRRDVSQRLQRADSERGEEGRQTQLKRAWEELPSSERSKSWQGELAGAKTDCSVLKAGEEVGEVVTEDQRILDMCEEREGVSCRSLR